MRPATEIIHGSTGGNRDADPLTTPVFEKERRRFVNGRGQRVGVAVAPRAAVNNLSRWTHKLVHSSQFAVHSLQFTVCGAQLADGATKSGLDRFDSLAAGGDDRLDELVVGVLVAAVDELRDAVPAIGSFVVDSREIESAQAGVRRSGQRDAGEFPAGALPRVSQVGGFEGG